MVKMKMVNRACVLKSKDAETMLFYCWAIIYKAGPAVKQQRVDVLYMVGGVCVTDNV